MNKFFYSTIQYHFNSKGNLVLTAARWNPYRGPWGFLGGGPSAQTVEQQNLNIEQTQQTMQFDSQLMTLFNQQFANQQNQLNFLKGVLQPEITSAQAGNGFSAPALAAMRTSATDTISNQFKNAQSTLNDTLRTQGDVNIPSGVTAGADRALLTSEAQTKSGAQNQITLANAGQAQSNLWNAVNALNGVAAQNNPAYLASSANEGGSVVANLSSSQANLQNAITNANANSFMGSFMKSLGGGLGGGLAGMTGDAGDSELMSVFG